MHFSRPPKSPNLYWAYTELPRPFIDVRPALEFELALPFRMFPMLKDPEHAQHSPEQWADIISHAYFTLSQAMSERPAQKGYGWEARLAATGLALRGYTPAKRELVASGYDASAIDRMPVGQVIAIDEAHFTRFIADEMRKWTLVPEAQGWRRAGKRLGNSPASITSARRSGRGRFCRSIPSWFRRRSHRSLPRCGGTFRLPRTA